jgi:predicted Zn-dependent protease
LARLIEVGEADPAIFLWAGSLAEAAEDWAAAETLYDHARVLMGYSARLASLYLARLHYRRGRPDIAGQLLRQYLDRAPEDAAARALLAVVEASPPPSPPACP